MTNQLPVKPRILHVAPEMAPLVKTGGLGDVTGSLPGALLSLGADCRVIMPAYPGVLDKASDLGLKCTKTPASVHVALNHRVYSAKIWRTEIDKVQVYLLEQPELYDKPKIYPDIMDADTVLPFIFLGHAALELAGAVKWKPQILHLHDWPSASAATALKWHSWYSKMSEDYDTVFTIHNISHQGIIPPHGLGGWGYTRQAMEIDAFEFYGQVNLLKGAVMASDILTTVSPRYSWDVQTQEGGMGLDGAIRAKRARLFGILNGIDEKIWNPKDDKLLPANYSPEKMKGKEKCRIELEKMCGFEHSDAPIITFVGRLVEQKGIDLILSAIDNLVSEGNRFVIIGSGNPFFQDRFKAIAESNGDKVWCYAKFDEKTAHLAYAGGDLLLMPSLFEPCGISQLIAMKYGTIPVARAVGGIADTVIDADGSYDDGTGFLFMDYRADEMSEALRRAIHAMSDKGRWDAIRARAMRADFSWAQSAKIYLNHYLELLGVDERIS